MPAAAAAESLVMSDSVRPQRRQPTRLPHPWDSPGKNTGVSCHFLLQCIHTNTEQLESLKSARQVGRLNIWEGLMLVLSVKAGNSGMVSILLFGDLFCF